MLVGKHRFHVLGRRIFAIDVFGETNRLALVAVLHWELLDLWVPGTRLYPAKHKETLLHLVVCSVK